MTKEQIEHVQQSWSAVLPMAKEAGLLFYEKLFALAPEVRPLFAHDIGPQASKLVAILGYAVGQLKNMDDLLPAVQNLGARHAGYGAEPKHYEAVGQALLATLAQGLGNAWTPEVKDAWTTAYNTLKNVMIVAQTEAKNLAA